MREVQIEQVILSKSSPELEKGGLTPQSRRSSQIIVSLKGPTLPTSDVPFSGPQLEHQHSVGIAANDAESDS